MRSPVLFLLAVAATATAAGPCGYRIAAKLCISREFPLPFGDAGKLGFRDAQGFLVIPAQYDPPNVFRESVGFFDGVARVTLQGQQLFLDIHGNVLFSPPPDMDVAWEVFSEGLLRFRRNGLYGYLNREGNVAIAAQFSSAGEFSEGLARVRTPTGWGYVNPAGTPVIPAVFEDALDFHGGLAAVRAIGGWGAINQQGYTIVPFQFGDAAELFQATLIPTTSPRRPYATAASPR